MSHPAGTATAKVEEYLETIYNMAMEGEVVIGARLAEKFGVAPPSVTEMLKRLVRDGYVDMDDRRQVTLTAQGQELAEALGHPTTCPHGNPIPGYVDAKNYLSSQNAFRLSQADPGAPVSILCISEVVEDEEELIHYLNDKELKPGHVLSLARREGAEASILLTVGDREVSIPERVASKIWVVKA
jgi:DtxR family Mn-dependent transcriptional regulator